VTQRESPGGLPPGIEDDEEEERTTVGAAPDHVPNTPQPFGPPPKVHYGKQNTPTAFTPQGAQQHAQTPQTPPQSDRRPAVPRVPGGSPTIRQPEQRTSSGPQPLHTPGPPNVGSGQMPQMTPMTPMGPPNQGQGQSSGLMPFAQPQSGGGPVAQGQTSQNRNEVSFAGPSPLGQAQNMTGGMGGLGTAGAGLAPSGHQALGLRADQQPMANRTASFHITRSRAYSFVLDARGQPIELGSGRFAKVFLGEERWMESKTDFRRPIVIKILQKGVSEEDHMRFQMEKELLERVQGHPNIVELFASGEAEDNQFLPPGIQDKCDTEFMILEKLDMSLEERLKGSRNRGAKEDLLACDMRERLFRVLDYMIPIASGVEYAHLVRNICHRDIKPANVLVGLPDPNLRGSTLQVRLADFNVAKLSDEEVSFGMTRMKAAVPGTLFFQSPEQETNILELLVNVQQGLPEVEYFEDFYIQISKNDSFSLFNRNEQYPVLYADRARKRLVLGRPYREPSETNVRARIQKSVGRPADIYSLGATFYYLISGAYANPKTLYDAFHKFIEYERADENNTIESYLRHEYSVINSLRAPKSSDGSPEVAPADRFFSYKHYLDGNGELIDPNVMLIIAKCMIRNKPDSYCQAHDLDTRGISDLVSDLINLYSLYGFQPGARPTHLVHRTNAKKGALKGRVGSRLRMMWLGFLGIFRKKPK
jgi:serine/threonine protein kinase